MEILQEYQNKINQAEKACTTLFEKVDEIALRNQEKVLKAFQKEKIQQRHFAPTSGYGYDDIGKIALNKVYCDAFECEDAIVSPLIVSGTHALSLMLFGILRPNDLLLSITGSPYDTLNDIIYGKENGSLEDFGVKFDSLDADLDTNFEDFTSQYYKKIKTYFQTTSVKAVFIQRSRGYSQKNALSVQNIANIIQFVKQLSPKTLVLVDNCYGEFVDLHEPTFYGADLMAGSLIKNAGGGIAPTGGYVAGKADLVEKVAFRLTTPSIGSEVGSYMYGYMPFFQGLFLAPSTVKNAIKGTILMGKAFEKEGFSTIPSSNELPNDIIRSIKFDTEEQLVAFCQSIQEISPIDSNVLPEPWEMPGYQHKVIMAAGTFVQGSSIELSADSPIKKPYIAYVQGGLTYEHLKIATAYALQKTSL